jgi:hypothetical protein
MQHDLDNKNILTSRNNFVIVKTRTWKNFEGDVL